MRLKGRANELLKVVNMDPFVGLQSTFGQDGSNFRSESSSSMQEPQHALNFKLGSPRSGSHPWQNSHATCPLSKVEFFAFKSAGSSRNPDAVYLPTIITLIKTIQIAYLLLVAEGKARRHRRNQNHLKSCILYFNWVGAFACL